jgi:hypothetical protein
MEIWKYDLYLSRGCDTGKGFFARLVFQFFGVLLVVATYPLTILN